MSNLKGNQTDVSSFSQSAVLSTTNSSSTTTIFLSYDLSDDYHHHHNKENVVTMWWLGENLQIFSAGQAKGKRRVLLVHK